MLQLLSLSTPFVIAAIGGLMSGIVVFFLQRNENRKIEKSKILREAYGEWAAKAYEWVGMGIMAKYLEHNSNQIAAEMQKAPCNNRLEFMLRREETETMDMVNRKTRLSYETTAAGFKILMLEDDDERKKKFYTVRESFSKLATPATGCQPIDGETAEHIDRQIKELLENFIAETRL
jgi:hypothetical protein